MEQLRFFSDSKDSLAQTKTAAKFQAKNNVFLKIVLAYTDLLANH